MLKPINEFLLDIQSTYDTENNDPDYTYLVSNKTTGEQLSCETYKTAELQFERWAIGDTRVVFLKCVDGMFEPIAEYPG